MNLFLGIYKPLKHPRLWDFDSDSWVHHRPLRNDFNPGEWWEAPLRIFSESTAILRGPHFLPGLFVRTEEEERPRWGPSSGECRGGSSIGSRNMGPESQGCGGAGAAFGRRQPLTESSDPDDCQSVTSAPLDAADRAFLHRRSAVAVVLMWRRRRAADMPLTRRCRPRGRSARTSPKGDFGRTWTKLTNYGPNWATWDQLWLSFDHSRRSLADVGQISTAIEQM